MNYLSMNNAYRGADDNSRHDEVQNLTGQNALPQAEYDISSYFYRFFACGGKEMLFLEPEQAVLVRTSCIGRSRARMPYGELANVDHDEFFACMHAIKAPPLFDAAMPGCGCQTEKVEQVVFELHRRMQARGDTGIIRKVERLSENFGGFDQRLQRMEGMMDTMFRTVTGQEPPPQQQMTLPAGSTSSGSGGNNSTNSTTAGATGTALAAPLLQPVQARAMTGGVVAPVNQT